MNGVASVVDTQARNNRCKMSIKIRRSQCRYDRSTGVLSGREKLPLLTDPVVMETVSWTTPSMFVPEKITPSIHPHHSSILNSVQHRLEDGICLCSNRKHCSYVLRSYIRSTMPLYFNIEMSSRGISCIRFPKREIPPPRITGTTVMQNRSMKSIA